MQNTLENKTSWLNRSLLEKSVISVETLLFVLILIQYKKVDIFYIQLWDKLRGHKFSLFNRMD